jgi:hypothetical protein
MNLFLGCVLSLILAVQTALAGPINPPVATTVIGTGGGNDRVPTAWITKGDFQNWFTLIAGNLAAAPTSLHVAPFQKQDGSGVYKVPSGSTAHCMNGVITAGSTGGVNVEIVTDTASFAWNAAVGTLTAPVYWAGSATLTNITSNVTTYSPTPVPGIFHFSQNLYPGIMMENAQGQTLVFDCYTTTP